VIEILREALVWFPKSCEANYLLAKYLRPQATSDESLKKAISLLQKASNSFSQLLKSISSGKSLVSKNVDEDGDRSDDDFYDEIKETNMLLQWELSACEAAQQLLALLLCQGGKTDEASTLLKGLGFKWRLSREVLCYKDENEKRSSSSSSSSSSDASGNETSSDSYLVAIDNALPRDMLNHLKDCFGRESPFWQEHHYDVLSNYSRVAGYFSYIYPLRERNASNSVEQIIDKIYSIAAQHFPEVEKECVVAEWWVHTRPHSSGHQLHFDSDETRLETGKLGGKPQHPIASSILFVNESNIGGPTLVTNQILDGKIADRGWLAYPKENRLVTFDAKYLHGVIPGHGVGEDPTKRRLTFMVGFWKSISAQPRGDGVPGPGQPFPREGGIFKWPKLMKMEPKWEKKGNQKNEIGEQKVQPTPVSCVWEPIDDKGKVSAKDTVIYQDFFQGF